MKKFFRKFRRKDNFRLDLHREIIIDGQEMVIVGLSANGPWNDLTRLTVEFEPLSKYRR